MLSAQEQAQRIMSENPGAYFQNLLSRDTKRTTRSKVRSLGWGVERGCIERPSTMR